MFTIEQSDKNIHVIFQYYISGEKFETIIAADTANSRFEAKATTYFIKEALGDHLEAIRRNAYELGWKDAKSKKRAKRRHFFRFWNKDSVGY